MYTQCPDCATVFRVTADALRAAHGDVRCGVCSTSFNALDNLSEEPFKPAPPVEEAVAADDTITVVELPGTEVIELSTASEAVTAAPAEDPGSVAAALAMREDEPLRADLDRSDEYPMIVLEEPDTLAEPAARPAEPEDVLPDPYGSPRILIPDEMRKELADEALADAAARIFEEPEERAGPRRWPWTVGVATLVLLLAVQFVHGRRETLLRQPAIGPALAQVYALFGLPLAAPTDLQAYEVRQWGAAADAAQPGRLLFRASIVNRATYAQPYPLLRLVLQDRFGSKIGVRDVEPADYLPAAGPARLLSPGQRADAEIHIVDPGQEAVGFEMDVCLPTADGVRCANAAAPDAL